MDDNNRKMEFIINQQAQFAADIARLEQNIDKLQAELNQLRETVSDLAGVVSELAVSQQNTNAILEKLAERAVESAERQARTDERLNALTAIVERHISNHP